MLTDHKLLLRYVWMQQLIDPKSLDHAFLQTQRISLYFRGTSYHKTVQMSRCNSAFLQVRNRFNPLNAELNPICHLLILLGDLTFMSPCIVSIFQYISNKMQRHTVYLYLETTRFGWYSPIIRSAYTCIYSIWYLSHRYCYLPLSWKSWNQPV
jgi:hypothetical protein